VSPSSAVPGLHLPLLHRAQAAVKDSSAWLDSQLRVRKRLGLLGETVRRDLPKVNCVH
jgi:hypothetical protein